jgi:pimeloyl-ACP methyl ester carboxylesterase
MPRVQGDGVELAVVDEGDGPAVLLLHGFPDSSHLWRHQIAALTAAGYRAIAPDLRGFGDSERPADVAAYGVRHSVADMLAVLDALEVKRAHVVAHDWGGAVGWSLAGFASERVERLVVLSVGHPNALRRPTIEQRERSWYPLLFQFEGTAEELLMHDGWRLFREWTRGDGDTERAIADLSRPGALTAALNWYRASWRPDEELREHRPFPSVAADTLGIWSTGDHYLLEEGMAGSDEYVVGEWRYERLEGPSHWMQLDAPERVNELILEWLQHNQSPPA